MSGSKEKESSFSHLFVDGVNVGTYRCMSMKDDYNLPSGLNMVSYHFNEKVGIGDIDQTISMGEMPLHIGSTHFFGGKDLHDKVFPDSGGKTIQADINKVLEDMKDKDVEIENNDNNNLSDTKGYIIKIYQGDDATLKSDTIYMTLKEKNAIANKLKRIQSGESSNSFDMEGSDGVSYIVPSYLIRDRLVTITCVDATTTDKINEAIKTFILSVEYDGKKYTSIPLGGSKSNFEKIINEFHNPDENFNFTIATNDGSFFNVTKEILKSGVLNIEFVY